MVTANKSFQRQQASKTLLLRFILMLYHTDLNYFIIFIQSQKLMLQTLILKSLFVRNNYLLFNYESGL